MFDNDTFFVAGCIKYVCAVCIAAAIAPIGKGGNPTVVMLGLCSVGMEMGVDAWGDGHMGIPLVGRCIGGIWQIWG